MLMKRPSLLILNICALLILSGCGGIEVKEKDATLVTGAANTKSGNVSKQALTQKRVQLFIGQDLNSIRGYVRSGQFPQPAGVTTYLSFYNLLSSNFPAYGGLGLDVRGYPTTTSVNWGAGPLNAFALAKEYPKAALNIGLNVAEGNQSTVWVKDGLAAITRGDYDKEINRLGTFFNSISNPVYLRIGYEFDGVWNKGYENTRRYIDAYRYIVDKLRVKQLSNVAFVWQGSASPVDDILESKREAITAWYPGDNYVDWIGLSWFLTPDKSVKGAATQRKLANELVQFARLKKKPVIIAESSPQGYDLSEMSKSNISPVWDGASGKNLKKVTSTQVWSEWYAPLFTFVRDNADVIRALSYINTDWDAQDLWSAPYPNGYWGDSRLQVNKDISRKWLSEISDKSFWALTE